MDSRRIERLAGRFAVARLGAEAAIPEWACSSWWSVTRTAEELSIVTSESRVPAEVRAERGFVLFRVAGAIPFDAIGVLRRLLSPLESAGVSALSFSTFDTDHLLVREADAARAIDAWRSAGFSVE